MAADTFVLPIEPADPVSRGRQCVGPLHVSGDITMIALDQLPEAKVMVLPGRGETVIRYSPGDPASTLPPVLLLHGYTASADLQWITLYHRLAGRAWIAMDHHGHGRGIRSTDAFTLEQCADDAAEVVRQLGLGPVVVVGYSMGGPISMLFAQRHPTLTSGLVLAATALEWRSSRRERWVVWPLVKTFMRVLPDQISGRGVQVAVDRSIDANPALAPWRGYLVAEYRRADRIALVQAAIALSKFDGRPWAASLGYPTAVVHTDADRVVLPAKQTALARMTKADVVGLHGDHDVNWSDGEAFASAICDAIAIVERRLADALVRSPSSAA
jgi:3-oxoadipate enol-lactonase